MTLSFFFGAYVSWLARLLHLLYTALMLLSKTISVAFASASLTLPSLAVSAPVNNGTFVPRTLVMTSGMAMLQNISPMTPNLSGAAA